jgi:hypothetical protein
MWSLKTYLFITGIGAFAALTLPWLVVIGLFLFIIPGLILGVMPTAFMYGLGFAVIRWLLASYFSGIALNALAAAVTLALFWLIPQPGLRIARATYAATKQPDVDAAQTITLRGHVLLIQPFGGGCDSVCVALLKTPSVTSVGTVDRNKRHTTYRIAPVGSPGRQVTAKGHGLLEEVRRRRSIGRTTRAGGRLEPAACRWQSAAGER